MKKITLIITAISVILLILGGCKKKEVDIRDQYIGDWDFVTKIGRYITDSISGERVFECDTIIYYSGIIYAHEVFSNQLIILFTETRCERIAVDKFGNLGIACMNSGYECGAFVGEDRIHFELYCYFDDPNIIIVDGTKRKGGENE